MKQTYQTTIRVTATAIEQEEDASIEIENLNTPSPAFCRANVLVVVRRLSVVSANLYPVLVNEYSIEKSFETEIAFTFEKEDDANIELSMSAKDFIGQCHCAALYEYLKDPHFFEKD